MRYFLRLAYLGGRFHGWQRQPGALSVQQCIEEALSTVMRREVQVVGAGRTDAGVNAACMYAHFDSDGPVADSRRLLTALNRLCGPDIALQELLPVSPDAHARFDAILRTYKYFVCFGKSPFFGPLAWQTGMSLDLEAMNRASELLLHTDDFTSFAKLHSDARTNICRVSHARWTALDDPRLGRGAVFTISADRFLRNMVRAVVGTLVDVGRGKLDLKGFAGVVESRDRCAAGTSMPACGLYLWDVVYPPGIFLTEA